MVVWVGFSERTISMGLGIGCIWKGLKPASAAAFLLAPLTAAAQPPQRASYIRADGRYIAQAFGSAMAERILSDEFRSTRTVAVLSSAREIPGYNCPANPIVSLVVVVPFPGKPGAVSWLERWVIGCDVQVQRNFIAILENNYLRIGQLLPGTTLADPMLQRDANAGIVAVAAVRRPSGCNEPGKVIDTAVSKQPERPGVRWNEVWTVMQCGARLPLPVTFTPASTGGVTWSVGPPSRP
jgi:hypothetical protein